MLRRLIQSLFILLLIVGCSVNIGHNPILTLNIATKQSEKSCKKECEKNAQDIGNDNPKTVFCTCMHDCTKNENWCDEQLVEDPDTLIPK